MRALLNRIFILLAVIGLIAAPPILTGYVILRQADSTMERQEYALAAEYYGRAVRFLPWRKDLFEQIGNSYFLAGPARYDIDARIWLEKARKNKSLSARGWTYYGYTYLIKDQPETALDIWLTGLEMFPTYHSFHFYTAVAYRELGMYPEEQKALGKWVVLGEPVLASSHYRFGQLLSIYQPDHAREQFLNASLLDDLYDPLIETMLATLDLAALEPDEAHRLIVVGRGLGLVNEWELAAESFHQAVAADEENAEAWAWLGEAEQQLGRNGRAELNKALRLDYKNPIVHSLSGLYWMRQGQPGIALSEYKLAAIYDPNNPAWQISIGEAYAFNGDLQAALASYFRATELAPTDATVWRLLASFSAQYNIQVEQVGLPAAQMAVELVGEDPLALDVLGWNLALLERYDEAHDTLEHALSLDPELPQGHLHLAIVAMQTNDWEVANEHLRQARDLDPGGPVGEQAQRLLNQYFP